jgi:hypothetical protein
LGQDSNDNHAINVLMGWRRHIFFVDDNLIGLPAKAKELLRALIPWMEGRLLPITFSDDIGSQTGAINVVPTRPAEEIARELLRIYEVLYEPRAYAERTFNNFARMRLRPIKKAFQMPTSGELRAVAIAAFRQMILSPCRWTFFKLFVKAIVTFPGRLPDYLTASVVAEHYFEYRRTIRQQMTGVASLDPATAPSNRAQNVIAQH